MDWNEERIAVLEKLWREGLSASQIARQLGGVSRCAVIGKVHRLGINGRETPQRPRPITNRVPAAPRLRAVTTTPARPIDRPLSTRVFQPRQPAPISFVGGPTASLVSLEAHSCRWPFGEPGEADFGFCGRNRAEAGPYCPGHMAISRRPQSSGRPVAFPGRRIAADDQDQPTPILLAANG
ncbi:GcrA family cell cycle regulator [soil metagenome]